MSLNANVSVEQLESLIEKYRAMVAVEKEGDAIPRACGGTRTCVLVNVVFELEDVLRKKRMKESLSPLLCRFGSPCGSEIIQSDSNSIDSDPGVTRSSDGTED